MLVASSSNRARWRHNIEQLSALIVFLRGIHRSLWMASKGCVCEIFVVVVGQSNDGCGIDTLIVIEVWGKIWPAGCHNESHRFHHRRQCCRLTAHGCQRGILNNINCHVGGFIAFHYIGWRHDKCHGLSNHQPHHCLLNRLFSRVNGQ